MDQIANLDAFLRDAGEDIILRRMVQGQPKDVKVRASKRLYRRPLATHGGGNQTEIKVVMSMTQIRAANWLAPLPAFGVDHQVPRKDDILIIQGRIYGVSDIDAIAVQNVVVRVNIIAIGNQGGL